MKRFSYPVSSHPLTPSYLYASIIKVNRTDSTRRRRLQHTNSLAPHEGLKKYCKCTNDICPLQVQWLCVLQVIFNPLDLHSKFVYQSALKKKLSRGQYIHTKIGIVILPCQWVSAGDPLLTHLQPCSISVWLVFDLLSRPGKLAAKNIVAACWR